jgi:hypothetical protein
MISESQEIERWLIKRGLPHFIDNYSATKDVLTRALPYLIAIFFVELFFVGDISGEQSLARNVTTISLAALVIVAVWMTLNILRKRSVFSRPASVGYIELLIFVAGPPALIFAVGGQSQEALVIFAINCALLFVLYFGTSYAVVPIARWALGFTRRQLSDVFALFVRSLPLLLLFSAIIFLTGEIWQMCDGNSGLFFAISMGIIVAVGVFFAVFKVPDQISELSTFETRDVVQSRLEGTPAADVDLPETLNTPPLSRRQWGNVGLVVVISEGVQGAIVSLLMFIFFIVFGVFAVSRDTIAVWVGSTPDTIFSFSVLGQEAHLTHELLRISIFVSVLSGLYFTVNSLTDSSYRKEFLESLLDEVRVAFAVRAAYHELLRDENRLAEGSDLGNIS